MKKGEKAIITAPLDLSPTLMQHAALRAAEHTCDDDVRCRRWRRGAAVRRSVVLAVLLAVVVVATNHTLVAHRLWAHGALTAQQASSNVNQMFFNA